MKRFRRIFAPILGALLIVLSITGSAFAADKYVALGDSYSAGNGANSTNLDASCNRNTYAYPYLLTQQKGYTLTFVACAGAVTGDVINSQVNSVTSDTKLVTITIGGNDIGFTNLIIACTTLGCSSQIAASQNQINTQLPAKLDATYNAIRAKSATARVVVLGYGRPFASSSRRPAATVSQIPPHRGRMSHFRCGASPLLRKCDEGANRIAGWESSMTRWPSSPVQRAASAGRRRSC